MKNSMKTKKKPTKTTKTKTTKRQALSIFHIGEDFYYKSGTLMGAYYDTESRSRLDLNAITKALKAGKVVNIRPANSREMKWAKEFLTSITSRKEKAVNV